MARPVKNKSQEDAMFKDRLFQGKRILVTGGGTGLGKAMAEKFLTLGADFYICGRRKAVLDATANELGQAWRARHGLWRRHPRCRPASTRWWRRSSPTAR